MLRKVLIVCAASAALLLSACSQPAMPVPEVAQQVAPEGVGAGGLLAAGAVGMLAGNMLSKSKPTVNHVTVIKKTYVSRPYSRSYSPSRSSYRRR